MRDNEKYLDAEKLVDEALIADPGFSLPDNFAEIVAEKVGRKFAWQQLVVGINIIVVFILFADRVLLRYFMFKAEEGV